MKLLNETLNIMRGNLTFSIRILQWHHFRETLDILANLDMGECATFELVRGQFDGLVIRQSESRKLPHWIVEGRIQCDIEYANPGMTPTDRELHVPIKEWIARCQDMEPNSEFVLRRYANTPESVLLLATQQRVTMKRWMPTRRVNFQWIPRLIGCVSGNVIRMPSDKLKDKLQFVDVAAVQFDLERMSEGSDAQCWSLLIHSHAFNEQGSLDSHHEARMLVESGVHFTLADPDQESKWDAQSARVVASGKHLGKRLHQVLEKTTCPEVLIVLSEAIDTKQPGLCRLNIPFGEFLVPNQTHNKDELSFTYHPDDLHFSVTFAHANLANLVQVLQPCKTEQPITMRVVCDSVSDFRGVLMGNFTDEFLFFAIECEHVGRYVPFGCEVTFLAKDLLCMLHFSRTVKRLTLDRPKGETERLCVTAFESDSIAQPAWRATLKTIWQ